MKVVSILVLLQLVHLVKCGTNYTLSTIEPESPECQRCGSSTECIDEKCHCLPGLVGDPYFVCFPTNDTVCSIRNDPLVEIFTNQHYSEKLMADVYTANVKTERNAAGDGHCESKVWTYLDRIEGKLYVSQFQMEFIQVTGIQNIGFVLRVDAYTDNDVYVFDVYYYQEGAFKFWFKSRSDAPLVMRKSVTTEFCEIVFNRVRPNIFSVEAHCCGVVLGIRPYNPKFPKTMPGFYINVNGSHKPEFPESDNSTLPLCLANTEIDVINIAHLQTKIDALVYLALTSSNMSIPFDRMPAGMTALRNTLDTCGDSERQKFITIYQQILGDPPLVRAVSNNVDGLSEVVALLNHIADYVCLGYREGCNKAQEIFVKRIPRGLDILTKQGWCET